jgi:hypothetical protein
VTVKNYCFCENTVTFFLSLRKNSFWRRSLTKACKIVCTKMTTACTDDTVHKSHTNCAHNGSVFRKFANIFARAQRLALRISTGGVGANTFATCSKTMILSFIN